MIHDKELMLDVLARKKSCHFLKLEDRPQGSNHSS